MKYYNHKTEYDGMTFDSKRELNRYIELKLLERAHKISELERQKVFELIPAQREADTIGARGGTRKGKVIEQAVKYIADFCYKDENGETVVEDTKGFRTKDYVIKRKLMLYKYGIKIIEV